MRLDIVVVGGPEEVVGYKLAGISRVYPLGTEGLKEGLKKEKSLIFMTGKAREALEEDIADISRDSIIFTIPEKGKPYTRVGDIIRDTIGFDLRK